MAYKLAAFTVTLAVIFGLLLVPFRSFSRLRDGEELHQNHRGGIFEPVIVNGTNATVQGTGEDFVLCYADTSDLTALSRLQIEWRDSANKSLPLFPNANLHVYQLGSGQHVLHAYLVLFHFSTDQEVTYMCVLSDGVVEVNRTISLRSKGIQAEVSNSESNDFTITRTTSFVI